MSALSDGAQLQKTQAILDDVVSRWSPPTDEGLNIRMMRALLLLAAYERDAARVGCGETPIRTDYPIALPSAVNTELLDAAVRFVREYDTQFADDYQGSRLHHIAESARAAIAKAKGHMDPEQQAKAWREKAERNEHPGRAFCMEQAERWESKAKGGGS